jgi:hypothetical protein
MLGGDDFEQDEYEKDEPVEPPTKDSSLQDLDLMEDYNEDEDIE